MNTYVVDAYCGIDTALGPVARSMVSANHWLSSMKINRLSWYLSLVSANHWLSSIKTNRLSWYLTLASANHWLNSKQSNRLSWYLSLVSANHWLSKLFCCTICFLLHCTLLIHTSVNESLNCGHLR